MDGLFHIEWTWTMTAQERKDFRRVQKSRDVWKKPDSPGFSGKIPTY